MLIAVMVIIGNMAATENQFSKLAENPSQVVSLEGQVNFSLKYWERGCVCVGEREEGKM